MKTLQRYVFGSFLTSFFLAFLVLSFVLTIGLMVQIVGYILSEDPTYITNHNNARTLIRKIDRDELLNALVRSYLGI